MNLKPIYISTGILAVLAAITYFVKNSDSSQSGDPRVGETIADVASLRGVSKIELQTDDQMLTFSKSADSSKWHLGESYDLPASMDRLGSTITKLIETRLERVASSNSERIADFGFGGNSIRLSDESGASIINLELGRETETGKQLVRFAGETKAFLANDQFSIDSNPVSWLDKSLVSYERKDLREAAVTLIDGSSLSVSRSSAEEDWQTSDPLPEGKELDQAAIGRLLNRFANASFTNVTNLENPEVAAAKESSAKFQLGFADQSSLDITIGQRPEVKTMKEVETENEAGEPSVEMEEEVETPAGPVYIFVSSSDPANPINGYMRKAAFEMAAYQFTSIPKSIDELLKDLPEPAAE